MTACDIGETVQLMGLHSQTPILGALPPPLAGHQTLRPWTAPGTSIPDSVALHSDLCRVPHGHGKSWNLGRPFSRPGKSWKIAKVIESHGKVMENDDNVMEFLLLH